MAGAGHADAGRGAGGGGQDDAVQDAVAPGPSRHAGEPAHAISHGPHDFPVEYVPIICSYSLYNSLVWPGVDAVCAYKMYGAGIGT